MIAKLARQVGFPPRYNVQLVSPLPHGDWYALAETEPAVDGHRLNWLTLEIRHTDSPGCAARSQLRRVRIGRWTTSSACVKQEERWRVEYGTWLVDIRLGPGVAYESAERIVLAIRQKNVVDRLGPDARMRKAIWVRHGDLEAGDIQSIEVASTPMDGFRVQMGRYGGVMLWVRVKGDRVEAYECYPWAV